MDESDKIIYSECLYEAIEGVEPDFNSCGIKCEECKYHFAVQGSELKSAQCQIKMEGENNYGRIGC